MFYNNNSCCKFTDNEMIIMNCIVSSNNISIKCHNYILCNNTLPFTYNIYNNKLCYYCDNNFGKKINGKGYLNFKDNINCPICLEIKLGVDQPYCNHYICIDCTKSLKFYNYGRYFDKNGIEVFPPIFPYDDNIEEEYNNNPNSSKWIKYDLIKLWIIENEIFYKKYDPNHPEYIGYDYYSDKNYLKYCPICRK